MSHQDDYATHVALINAAKRELTRGQCAYDTAVQRYLLDRGWNRARLCGLPVDLWLKQVHGRDMTLQQDHALHVQQGLDTTKAGKPRTV